MSSSARSCISCKTLLVPPTANFCAHCGFPQPGHSPKLKSELDATTELCSLTLQDFNELENDKKKQNQLSPNLPKVFLPVLNVPREESMKVQFNAVIPLTLWEWEEGKSSVYMRFGHKDIGIWERDIGPCTLHRGAGNGLFVVLYKISFDYEFLKDNQNGLSYKYVVYSPRSNSIGHQFEFLHGAPPCESIDNNRLLRIPQDKLKPGGCYRQFDTVILPDVKSNEAKSTDNECTHNEWWKSFGDPSAFVIPSPAVMRSLCMEIHLHAMKGIIINGIFSGGFSIQNAITAFQGLLNCVCVQWVEHKGKEKKWIVEGLGIYIKKWFESVLHELLTSTTLESHLRIVSGVLTAICFRNLMISDFIDATVTEEMKIGLLQVMGLSIVNGKEEFEFLQGMLKTPKIKKIVLDALLYYLSVDLKEDTHVITVIKALPLYHFLSGLSVPNRISLKEAPCVLNLLALNSLIKNNPNIFEMCCSTIFQLFQFDSQILIQIPYINCQKDPNFIYEVLPIELSIVWLRNLQSDIPNIYLSSISDEKMKLDFVKPMTKILRRIFIVEIKKFSNLSCYSEAAIYLMKSFKKNLDSSKNSEALVASVVSLLLHILYRAKKFDEETNDHLSLCQKLRYSTRELLSDWVTCPDVIGGSFFGGEVRTNFQELKKKDEELKFWESILNFKFPAIDMKNELDSLVLTIVSDRISNIPTIHLIIDAFVYIETQKDIFTCNLLRSTFFRKACDILGVMFYSITESRPNSNLVVELICELAKERHFSPTIFSSTAIPGQANHFIADDRKSFGSVSLKRNEESNEEIKKRKEEFKEKQNEQDDFAVDKNKEQSEMDQMVVVLKEEGIKTDFNQLCTNKEPNPKDRVEGLNVPFPTLPKAQQHDLSQDKNVRAHFNAGIQKDDWIKDGELNIGSCEKSSKSKENGGNGKNKLCKTSKSTSDEIKKEETSGKYIIDREKEPLLGPILPENQLYVLQPPKDKAMRIRFNAVIQKGIWKWEEGKSSVFIRFGHKNFGDWKLDIGPCILHRDAGDGFHTVRYDMSIDTDFMKSLRIGLPYKYVVYSPLMKVTKHQYEYLHGAPYQGANTSRLLKVPKEELFPGSYYRQFDTMILPEVKVKTAKGTIKELLDSISMVEPADLTTITLPTPTLMRRQCMEIFLQPTKEILLSGRFKSNLEIITNGFVNLTRCAYLQWVEHRGGEYCWKVSDIGPFLIDLVEALLVDLNKQRDTCTVTSAVFLAYSLYKFKKYYFVPVSKEFGISLLEAMSLSFTNGEKELEFLRSMIGISPEAMNGVVNVLVHYLRDIIKLQKPNIAIVIVKALPLYHFLCGFSVPNQQTFVSLNKITWGDTSLMIEKLQLALEFKSGFIQRHEKDIQRLLQFDSQLLFIIPYICPWEDTDVLSDMLPLELAIVWLIQRLNLHGQSYRLSLSSIKMTNCFKKPIASIEKRIYEGDIANFDVLVLCSDAANYLLESFKDKLDYSNNAKILVKSMISLFLHIFYKAKTFKDKAKNQETLCQTITLSIRKLLKDWVAHKDVIGGSFFGASFFGASSALMYTRTSYLRLKDDELEFWKSMLSITFPADDMKQILEAIVLDLVSDRVSAIPSPELKINLFVTFECREEISDSFRSIFLTEAIEALDIMFSKRIPMQSILRRNDFPDLNSERVVKLISKIIEKKYPDFHRKQEIPFDDLLEWEMWPGILKFSYAQVGKVTRGEWRLIVTGAVTKLETVCANINSGEINITELNIIKAKQRQMNQLCRVIDKSQMFDLPRSMEKRIKEFGHFKAYTMKLKYFIYHIRKVLVGQYDLMNELQENYENEKINKLCVTASDGSCRVVCFPDAKPLDPCLDGFFVISSKYSSDIFNRLWHKNLSEQPAAVDFSRIYPYVWQPTLQSCTLLLKKLKSRDITLLEVDDQFKLVYFNKLDKLEKDLINLQHAVDAINHTVTGDINWIKNAVVHIGQYWDLCGYKVAAEAFLKIRDTLDLTGDFVIVERVASKISLGGTTLSIDHSAVDAGKFFQEYANNPNKAQCLVAFAECQNIIEWMRKETKDLTNLATFISSSVAGREGSMTADKLLFLYTVGSGFSPLIYKLTKNASCQKLRELCKTVWMELEMTPYLPELLKSCERDIDWYKSFKEKYETKIHLR